MCRIQCELVQRTEPWRVSYYFKSVIDMVANHLFTPIALLNTVATHQLMVLLSLIYAVLRNLRCCYGTFNIYQLAKFLLVLLP
jgi:hypothetical protein